jgi:flagellar protein FliO/FliZ
MDTLFGEGQSGLKVVLFVIVVLGLLALAFWLLRQFGGGRLVNSATRERQPRLGVVDQATVDSRRRLVLIRRDNVEHLLFIGGPSDVVVEQNIVRAATAEREPGPARPPAMPRVPVAEDSMWPLQPEPAPPGARTPRKVRTADPLAELADQLSRVRGVGEPAEQRRPPRLQPAPPARSTADAALKPATAEMAQPPTPRKARTADPLVKLADQLLRVPGVGEPAEERRPPRLQPAPPARSKADDDQNLSEIAQRLEATLRHPAKGSDDARTAAGNPKTTGDADEPRAPSEAPKAPSEPAAPPREPDAQSRDDDKTPSEPAALPREPDTQGRGDDKAPSEPAAPPRELDTQGPADDKAPSEPAAPPLKPDTPGRGDDGSNQK